jgi:hypothetical protein
MLIRAIALSIALLIGASVIIPLSTDETQAARKHHHKRHRHHHYRKYSKAWWRHYHAQQRRRRALAARRRALRLRQLRLAQAQHKDKSATPSKSSDKTIVKTSAPETSVLLPSGEEAPRGWKRGSATPGEIQFRLDDSSGAQIGTASLTVVGPAMGESSDTPRNKSLAGVPTTSLRREVINRMIGENGWVVNDYSKDINGKKVYVVVAQSQSGGRVNSRMFYFTEVDGRIYSLSTSSGADSADRIADESEKVINSLQNGKHVQKPGVKTEE